MFTKRKTQVEHLIEQEQKLKERKTREEAAMRAVCRELFNSKSGKFFLHYLKKQCGWNDQDNNINSEVLIYKKGRRDIWVILRNLLPKEIVAQIEIYEEGDLTK